MKFRNLSQILCWIVIVNCTIKDVRAIFFDELFEYFLDGISDSDESSSNELTSSSLNVTCKNCTLTVECHNCTQSDKDTQSTTPMQIDSQNIQQPTSTSLPTRPTPTIPAPERVVEIVSNNNASPEKVATVSQNTPSSNTTPVTSGSTSAKPAEPTSARVSPSQPNTKSIGDQITGDDTNTSTDDALNSSDGVTNETEN